MSPKIGIVAPAHRPQNWMSLYKSIGDNDIDFELVFVGPNSPDYKLPNNFRFIRSLVKPTQCLEIAFRNTTADYIMNIADDCEYVTPRPLDKIYNLYKTYNSDKVIVSTGFMTNGENQSHFAHHFFANDNSTPVMFTCGFMSKRFYRDLGGIDRNFIAVMWDCDVAMRAHALGARVVISDVYVNERRDKSARNNLCAEFWEHDRSLLEDLWITNGKAHLNRKNPVEPFSDMNILTISQGPRGRWRGTGPVFFERLEDSLKRSILTRIYRGIRKPSMYFNYVKRIIMRLKGQ
jgi:GT2 family glycosyltransferase